jgi:hypothetical protein
MRVPAIRTSRPSTRARSTRTAGSGSTGLPTPIRFNVSSSPARRSASLSFSHRSSTQGSCAHSTYASTNLGPRSYSSVTQPRFGSINISMNGARL